MKQDRLLRRYVWMLSEANHTSDYRPNAVKEFMFHNKCKRTLAKLQDAGIPTRTFMREEYNNENIESHYKMILELIEKGIICSEDLKYIIKIDRFMDCTNELLKSNTSNEDKLVLPELEKNDNAIYFNDKINDVDGDIKLKNYKNIDVDVIARHAVELAINKNSVKDNNEELRNDVANKNTNAQSKLNKEQIEKSNDKNDLSETEKEIIQSNNNNDLMM